MNSTEIAKSVPYMSAMPCGGGCSDYAHSRWGEPVVVAGTQVHILTRGHSIGGAISDSLNRLHQAGVVTREKVGRRVMWSLSPEYCERARETALLTAAILMGAGLSGATESELNAAQEIDTNLQPAQVLGEPGMQALIAERIADLTAQGVEVEWVADPIRSVSEKDCVGGIQLRRNGPLRYFRIELWERAPANLVAWALIKAKQMMEHPRGRFEDPRHDRGYTLVPLP